MSYKKLIEGKEYYGKHLIMDSKGCNSNLKSISHHKLFLKSLCDLIKMKRFGEAHANRFGEGDTTGISSFQLIYTSNIAIHTNDKTGDCYLDLFSCKWFDESLVIDLFIEYFNPVHYNKIVMLRQ